MQVVWRCCGPCKRPVLLVAPVASHENAALGCFVRITSAHHIDPHGRFAIHAIVNAPQPVIEPSKVKRREIERRVLGELRFSRVTEVLTAMDPWSNDQPLEAFLGPSQLDVIQVGDLSAPGIVPTRCQ